MLHPFGVKFPHTLLSIEAETGPMSFIFSADTHPGIDHGEFIFLANEHLTYSRYYGERTASDDVANL